MTSCAFTGHRPKNLPWGYNETDKACQALQEALHTQISQLAQIGCTDFLSGMALGVDTWAAQSVLALREQNPRLKLHCILPCQTQACKWPPASQKRYYAILRQADSIVYTSRTYYKNCMFDRNRFLVEHADMLLAVYNGSPQSGTAATVHYAQKLGHKVIGINPFTARSSIWASE